MLESYKTIFAIRRRVLRSIEPARITRNKTTPDFMGMPGQISTLKTALSYAAMVDNLQVLGFPTDPGFERLRNQIKKPFRKT